jgi:hypothetical protein
MAVTGNPRDVSRLPLHSKDLPLRGTTDYRSTREAGKETELTEARRFDIAS